MRFSSILLTAVCACGPLVAGGCAGPESRPAQVVEETWQAPPVRVQAFAPSEDGPTAIATVGGQPVLRSEFYEMLAAGHGVDLLEQYIVLERAKQLALTRGLTVTAADVQAEYDRALSNFLEDSNLGQEATLQRKAAESLLRQMLTTRGVSMKEYMLIMRRNAYLRKIAECDLEITAEQRTQEFDRLFGDRAQIRHIQVATRAEADSILQQLATGADFSALARRYSVNRESGEKGGMLPPLSASDDDWPAIIRQTAFALTPGQTSGPIELDGWFQIIHVDRFIPGQEVSREATREQVEQSLRERLADREMQRLHAKLFGQATIDIADGDLRDLFFAKHPDHQSRPQ